MYESVYQLSLHASSNQPVPNTQKGHLSWCPTEINREPQTLWHLKWKEHYGSVTKEAFRNDFFKRYYLNDRMCSMFMFSFLFHANGLWVHLRVYSVLHRWAEYWQLFLIISDVSLTSNFTFKERLYKWTNNTGECTLQFQQSSSLECIF